ncbi:MAG: CorA family divalent cation transporter [Bdellovibrionota bacterium]
MAIGKKIFSNREIQWVDVAAPTQTQFNELSSLLGLPESIIQNCLNPDYLPHVETYGSTRFVILRIPEPVSEPKADSVQELTTKIAVFISEDHVISVHRITELPVISEVTNTLQALTEEHVKEVSALTLLGLLFEQVALAFESPINQLEANMEKFEENIFNHKRSKALLQEGYYIKRKASAYRKVLKYTLELMSRLAQKELWQDSRDKLERYQFYAEDIFENTQGLLGLHLSIASQRTNEASLRTNEIMRVLTVLTIFFLPLNFIAGVFGMNFTHIPGLQHEWGFWASIALMLFISSALFIYIVVKGWLSPIDSDVNLRK